MTIAPMGASLASRRAPASISLRSWSGPLICAIGLSLPVLLVAMPPMVDFPAHEAVVGVLRHWGDPAYFPNDLYRLNWGHPNQLQYVLALPLAYLFGSTKAFEVVVALGVAGTILGTAWLARHLGKPLWVSFLVAPAAVGWNFQWGHVANLLGFAALLALLPAIDRFAASPTWRAVPSILASFTLLYFTHESALAVALVSLGVFSLAFGGDLRSFVMRGVPCFVAVGAAYAQVVVQKLSLLNAKAVLPFPLVDRLRGFPRMIVGRFDPNSIGLLFGLVVFAAAINWARSLPPPFAPDELSVDSGGDEAGRVAAASSKVAWRDVLKRHRFTVLGTVLLAAYFVLPGSYKGVFYFAHRFLPVAWCVLVVSSSPPVGFRRGRVPFLVACTVPVATCANALPAFAASNADYGELDRLLPAIAMNSSIYSVDLDVVSAGAINSGGFSCRNAQGHVVALRGGRALADYTQSPISPAEINPEFAWPVMAVINFEDPREFSPELIFSKFRYVLLHLSANGGAAGPEIMLQDVARLVAHPSGWQLFESKILGATLTEPEKLPYDIVGPSFGERLDAWGAFSQASGK